MPDTQIKDGWLIRPSFLSSNSPTRRTPILLLAYNAPEEAALLAEKMVCKVCRIPAWERLPAPVSAHPDMLCFPLPRTGQLLLPADYYRDHARFWEDTGIDIVTTDHPFLGRYPGDVGLNQLVMGGVLYGRVDHAARELLDVYPDRVAVKQGYARCSTLKLSENAAITADRTIATALMSKGVDVLLIEAGHIRLDGYDYGFIGGASFPLPDRSVGFFGDLSLHPDAKAIFAFAERHGVKLYSLSGELTDYGGGILL